MNDQTQTNQQSTQLDPHAAALTKAWAYTENGGKPNMSNPAEGKTGELKSIFQFEPGTWKAYAKQVSGDSNLPLTPENESLVAYGKVSDWLKKGYSTSQIASMINAGEGESNAWEGKFSDGSSSQGTNEKYGVKYNVPEYASKFSNYSKQFLKETLSGGSQNSPAELEKTPQTTTGVKSMNNKTTNKTKPESVVQKVNDKGLVGRALSRDRKS